MEQLKNLLGLSTDARKGEAMVSVREVASQIHGGGLLGEDMEYINRADEQRSLWLLLTLRLHHGVLFHWGRARVERFVTDLLTGTARDQLELAYQGLVLGGEVEPRIPYELDWDWRGDAPELKKKIDWDYDKSPPQARKKLAFLRSDPAMLEAWELLVDYLRARDLRYWSAAQLQSQVANLLFCGSDYMWRDTVGRLKLAQDETDRLLGEKAAV